MGIGWPGGAGALLALFLSGTASAETVPATIRVYGPGGPHRALVECAVLYEKARGGRVLVRRASQEALAWRVLQDADIVYAGSEEMLAEFDRRNPGLLDMATAERLNARRIGIVVRKGNPLRIRGLEDLGREGVHVMHAKLESMEPLQAAAGGGPWRLVHTGEEGLSTWRTSPEVDAWVTYRSWHAQLTGEAEFVDLTGDAAVRHTPLALTRRSGQPQAAADFVTFLKSPEARRVFQKHGWD